MSSQIKTLQSETIKTLQSGNNKNDNSFGCYIGSGGFGKVYEIKGTTLVKKEMDLRQHENIREICFLRTYNHVPFITDMKGCDIDTEKNIINMYMENAGSTLRELSKTMSLEERIKCVPSLLTQFSRILIWMKQEKILHCDIKPANICVDKEFNVKLIDWGFVQKFAPGKKYMIGTQVFYDPYTYDDIIDYNSEMFAFGISICYFLTSSFDYDSWDDFCNDFDYDINSTAVIINDYNKEAINIFGIEKLRSKFIEIFNNSYYYDIIVSMIDLNIKKRIQMTDLYLRCPFELRTKYSLIECYTHIYENEEINININTDNFTKIVGMVVDWMVNIKFNFKIKYSLFNALQIMFKYLNIKSETPKGIANVAVICLYISNLLNNEYIIDISRCTKLCNLQKKEVNDLMIDILTTLNFEVFPEPENIEFNKKDEDIWKCVFLESCNKIYNFILPSISQVKINELYVDNKQKNKLKLLEELIDMM